MTCPSYIINSYFPEETPTGILPDWAQLLITLDKASLNPMFTARFLDHAETLISAHPGYQKLSNEAQQSLSAYLAQRLAEISKPCLKRQTALTKRPLFGLQTNTDVSLNFEETLARYPVLARLAAQITLQHIRFATDFLSHLTEDWPLIEHQFRQRLYQVTQLHCGLSDPHHGGRSVMTLFFDPCFKLVYKPRDLSCEIYYFNFLAALNPHLTLPLRIVDTINRNDHGWMEYIEHRPCRDEQRQAYLRRCGYLLAVARFLRGSDFHHENLIEYGDQPVLIDLETLLQPHQPYRYNLISKARRILNGIPAGHLCSAIMKIEPPAEQATSLAYLQNGFTEAYRAIQQNNPLNERFLPKTTRLIYQDTTVYYRLINNALQAENLTNGKLFPRQFEILKQTGRLLGDEASLERAESECRMLCRLDIPYFSQAVELIRSELFAQLNDQDFNKQLNYLQTEFYLQNPAGEQPPSVPAATVDREETQRRIHELCSRQVQTILTMAERSTDHQTYWLTIKRLPNGRDESVPSDYGLYAGASGLLLYLAAWHKLHPSPPLKQFILDAYEDLHDLISDKAFADAWLKNLNLGLAEGLGGIIYSLCLAGQLLNLTQFNQTALLLTDRVNEFIIRQDERSDIFNGCAGLLLALTVLYRHTQNRAVLQKARFCADFLLSRQTVEGGWPTLNQRVIAGFAHGVSGIAYSLLRFHALCPERRYFDAAEQALHCENQFFDTDQHRWRAMASPPDQAQFWNGYCHGAAGIGLARLALIEAARQHPNIPFAFQNSFFESPRQLLLRCSTSCILAVATPALSDREQKCRNLKCERYKSSVPLSCYIQDLDQALAAASNNEPDMFDFPCCGETGKLELLLQSGIKLQRADDIDQAWQKAAWIIQRNRRHKGFYLFSEYPAEADNLSFFKGSTGCAYQLLRLCHPDLLPSILTFE